MFRVAAKQRLLAFGSFENWRQFSPPTDTSKKIAALSGGWAAGSAAKVIKIVDQRLIETPSFGNAPFSPTEKAARATAAQMRTALSTSLSIRETTREISEVLEAVGYLFAEFKLPSKLQEYARTLMRAAYGDTGEEQLLELSDLGQGKRLFPEVAAEIEALHAQRAELKTTSGDLRPMKTREIDEALKRKEGALARRVARLREKLREWQQRENLELVLAVDGTRKYLKGGGYEDVPSRYRLDVLRMAADIIEQARLDREYESKPALAFRRAASAVAHSVKRRQVALPEKRTMSPDAVWKQAKSWSTKYTNLWPEGSDARRAAAAAYLEWAIDHAKKCGVVLDEILPNFSPNILETQQLDLQTLLVCPTETELAFAADSAEIGIVLPDPKELCKKIEVSPAIESASQCAIQPSTRSRPPAHKFGKPLSEFIERAHATRERYEAERRHERARAAYEKSFSLADLKGKPKGTGAWKQYADCPECGTGREKRGRFNVNTRSGGYRCHACGVKGKLQEFWENPPTEWQEGKRPIITPEQAKAKALERAEREAQDAIEHAAKIEKARKFYESSAPLAQVPAARDYVQRRTGVADVAERCGVRYAIHHGRKAVLFPAVNQTGEMIAINDRRIDGDEDKTRTRGPKSAGVFATPGALDAPRVVIVESPLDAIAVYACGFDAIALCGTSWPAWFPDSLESKDVLLAQDNDKPNQQGKRAGDESATKLANELIGRASIQRLKPSRKDWCEIAELDGIEALRAELAAALFDASTLDDEAEVMQ